MLVLGLGGVLLLLSAVKASSRAFERLLVVVDRVLLGFAVEELATLILAM